MDTFSVSALALLILAAAMLYSSVGHGGASGYLAAMGLFGLAPGVMRPAALTLNILVSAIAAVKFYRAGCFSWPVFWPFALTSVPLAFVGGSLTLPTTIYKQIVGLVLLFAAYRLFRTASAQAVGALRARPLWLALMGGAAIGLLSGLTGVGGGIFLTPLLLLTGWAETRQAAGVSAAFILVNSIAGLLGNWQNAASLPRAIFLWAAAALVGGWVGSTCGSRRLASANLRRLLALVLVIAGLKMIFV
jgi:uncharacterized membrane protein YfcA